MPQQLIHAGDGADEPNDQDYEAAATFIEDGVVYRLTWAIEATRARRPDLLGEEAVHSRSLRCSVLLEAGTLSLPVALLLQLGLGSRRIAHEVVAREGIDFVSQTRMHAWVKFQRDRAAEDWDYLDVAIRPIWLSFIQETSSELRLRWEERTEEVPLIERFNATGEVTNAEGILRVLRDGDALDAEFSLMDGTPIGRTVWPFSSRYPDIASAKLRQDGFIRAVYLGP